MLDIGKRPDYIGLWQTGTLTVFLKRPNRNHPNWWLCYYNMEAREAIVWDRAIERVGKEFELNPFHQGCWTVDHQKQHPECTRLSFEPYSCPGVIQAWEMPLGCSEWALEFPDASLEDILEYGDKGLMLILAAIPEIFSAASR